MLDSGKMEGSNNGSAVCKMGSYGAAGPGDIVARSGTSIIRLNLSPIVEVRNVHSRFKISMILF